MEKTELNFPIMAIAPQVPKDGRGYISWKQLRENPEHLAAFIQTEASAFYGVEGNLSHRILIKNGRGALSFAINNYYSGGWRQLQLDLGLATPKPPGFWNLKLLNRKPKLLWMQG